MKAYILSVGNEVLTGVTINTNAATIATYLQGLGIDIYKVVTVGDDAEMISTSVQEFLRSPAQILITSGGLGPTHDDFTKEVVAKSLGLKLVRSEEALKDMYNYFQEIKSDCNVKQALIPENAKLIPNKIGSADGIIIEYQDKCISLLVGPPYELEPMLKDYLIPYLQKFKRQRFVRDYILMGESESYFENLLIPILKKFPNLEIAPYASNGYVRFRILANIAEPELEKAIASFESTFCDYIISTNNESIEEVVVKTLKAKKLKISFAESCSGGLLASMITNVSGASEVLTESFVTYSEEAKEKYLHVLPKTISEFDVVSKEVAYEMAKGLQELSKADVNVSVTGYAGPTGKDVGKICFAIIWGNKLINEEKHFHGNREMIRIRLSRYILYRVYKMLGEKNE